MTTKTLRFLALNTVRHRYWAPGRGLRTFLDESIPEQIGPLIGQGATVEDLVSGWWWKNVALQHTTEEIEAAAERIQAELKRRTELAGQTVRDRPGIEGQREGSGDAREAARGGEGR